MSIGGPRVGESGGNGDLQVTFLGNFFLIGGYEGAETKGNSRELHES